MFSKGLLIGKRLFQDRAMPGKKLPFSGHIANKFRRPTILQLNIEGLTASKMNVLYYLALQFEALVILLQRPTALMQKSWYFQASNQLGLLSAGSMVLPRFVSKGAFTAVYSTFFFQHDLGLFY